MSTRHCNVALFVPHEGCPHRCSFCDQRHIAGQAQPLTAARVRRACETAISTMRTAADASEIAFFGGSFTAIPRDYMCELLEAAYPYVRDGHFHGIRLSTRPDAVDAAVLELLRGYGVTAVELGAQSMDDRVLAENWRGHTAAQVVAAAQAIREAGFSLGLQMMTGLPGDTDEGALLTAERLAELQPDTMRIYPTLVIDNTELAQRYRRGEYRPQTLEEAVALCTRLLTFFEQERQIPVIRLGLHAERDMQAHYVAGPFHPAFRELCESRLLREQLLALLKKATKRTGTVLVHPARLSQAIGQKRENINALAALGYTIRVIGDASLSRNEIKLGSDVVDS